MSKYTMTIQEYCQGLYLNYVLDADPEADPVEAVVGMTEDDYYLTGLTLFPDNYPFYNDKIGDKMEFMRDFIDYFMYNEIGQDSVEKFKHTLKKFLRAEMGRYRQLYNSQIGDLAAIINTTDIERHISGDVLKKTGTIDRDGKVNYHSGTSSNESSSDSSSLQNGRTDTNAIRPLGSSAFSDLSRQTAGGTDVTTGSGSRNSSVNKTGFDENNNKETYNTTDTQDLTETRKGHEGVNIGDAVEKYRKLILDINSMIFEDMKKFGLFMLVW